MSVNWFYNLAKKCLDLANLVTAKH